MSFKPEVQTDSSGKWYGNALRFATYVEAESNARDLMRRWLLVREFRAIESDDPVNYRYIDHQLFEVTDPRGLVAEAVAEDARNVDGGHFDREGWGNFFPEEDPALVSAAWPIYNEVKDAAGRFRVADRVDGYDRDDIGESPDY